MSEAWAIYTRVSTRQQVDGFENTCPRLENILALQMYRHIATEATYKRCENENCARLFVHQSGRSKSGTSRNKGVEYCSYRCANAQGERRRRQQRNTDTPDD